MNYFLEDGQTLSHFPDWQQCRTEEREVGVSVLSSSVRALEADGESREADTLSQAWQNEREALLALGESLTRELPRAEGFFVGDGERARAHAAVCRFYTLAEPHFARMAELNARMRDLLDRTRKMILREDGVLRELLLAKHAVEQSGDTDLRGRISEIAEALYAVREGNAALRKRLDRTSSAWFDFCTKRHPTITVRIGACADLEHEGRTCDPRALSVLCAELVQLLGERESGS